MSQTSNATFADQVFADYSPLSAAAYDGQVQNVGNPATGDMAAAWWTGAGRDDKRGMWAELRLKTAGKKQVLDKDFRVQIDFEPTHYRPKAA